MKKLKLYIIIAGFLGLGACGDNFLDTEPITELTDENFYRTPNDAFRALVGCYDGLNLIWHAGTSFPVATEVMSDNCFGGGGSGDQDSYQMLDEFDQSRLPSELNMWEQTWRDYYRAIYRTNVLLQKMDGIEWGGDDDLRNTYEAETRFIRAFLYFDLARLFGDVPLITEATTENRPRTDVHEVYTLIAQDLKFAADNLSSVSYPEQNPANHGRVTKWAAEALIGRVFLYYTGYYGETSLAGIVSQSEALAYLEDVVENGGFGLIEDFASLWPAASLEDYAGEDNAEVIFSIKYTYTSDYDGNADGNHWMVMLGIREQSIFPYGNGWGFGVVTPRLWNAYNDDDTRKTASIISIDDEGLDFQNLAGQKEYTGYYVKKYAPMSDEDGNSIPVGLGGVNFMIGQFQDFIVMRYADVLLMAAELGSPNAQQYFNEVRQRAYKENFTPLAINQANIMNERRLEFAFEGIRLYDLLRQGINVAAAAIAETTTVVNGGVSVEKTISADRIILTKGLQQIPQNQITLSNGVLEQNAGW